jgi:predicted metal-dependent HD superfamily phosphohydrolase
METSQLKATWVALTRPYTTQDAIVQDMFNQLIKSYAGPKRHYHNLHHISALLSLQQQHTSLITDPDVLQFSIFFHDIVYNVLKKDNEAKSAVVAANFLATIDYPADKIKKVVQFIEATQTHVNSTGDTDLDYLLDFDLRILGAPAADYQHYQQQIRQEYAIFPDMLYNPGRKKVLQHFLHQLPVFKTSTFRNLYEEQAIANLTAELAAL